MNTQEQKLQDALKDADVSDNILEIDQIAWLIGSFPGDTGKRLRAVCEDCPNIKELLPEMTACPTDADALLRIAGYMDKENMVGKVADLIRKMLR
jgi:hypothetical protein